MKRFKSSTPISLSFLDTHTAIFLRLLRYKLNYSDSRFNMVDMKRQRENEGKLLESLDIANSLILLSRVQEKDSFVPAVEFECKTCNRKFSSFQALGGHRASHKKPKLDGEELMISEAKSQSLGMEKSKPKMHECSICGEKFSLGQALGGHMRKHRSAINEGLSNSMNQVIAKVPVLKRSNSKRIMCLDLNLTPLENDLKFLFGNKAPQVDISLF